MSLAADNRGLGIVLAIEVSNPSAWTARSPCLPGVVIAKSLDDSAQLIARSDIAPEDSQSDGLILAISRAMKQAGLSPSQIGTVAVSAGPGGYTATRLAITTAKMIAEVSGAACIAVPTADCIAHAAVQSGVAKPLAVALASKGESCFLTEFKDGAESAGQLLSAQEWNPVHIKTLIADAFLPASFGTKATSLGIERVAPIFDAFACASICHRYAAVDPVALSPIYPREPEAVTKWRALCGKQRQ